MKLKDFRIKEVVDANGDSFFFIERKGWFWWRGYDHFGYKEKEYVISKIKSLCDVDCKYHTVE